MTAPAATTCEFRRQQDLTVLTWPFLDGLDVEAMVTTRSGGVSQGPYASLNLSLSVGDEPAAVLENRRRVAAALGAVPGDLVFARQVHGGRALAVTAADRGRGARSVADAIPDADALVTGEPGIVLVTQVGDCVPIVLYDPVGHVLACVHAGWRGTVAGIGRAALEAMAALGTRPADVLAGIGPAIAPDRYQVGPEVAVAVRDCFRAAGAGAGPRGAAVAGDHRPGDDRRGESPLSQDRRGDSSRSDDGLADGAGGVLRPDGAGRWLLDLWAASRLLLARAGVPDSQIHVAAVPTGPAPGRFFSDRTARPCGRFALVARLKPRETQHGYRQRQETQHQETQHRETRCQETQHRESS